METIVPVSTKRKEEMKSIVGGGESAVHERTFEP